ncbi:MAG: hypothetical protein GXY85_02605 [Candidatus Brocadiaceae bacterium]|nr:hypothetical protein [Candidatus Brocadiaceae bacterium]
MGTDRPKRKTPAHLPAIQRFNTSIVVFVTVCTARRAPILARGRAHETLLSAWQEARLWGVGRYVLMPDHIHMFCSPMEWECPALGEWIKYWKSIVSRKWPWPDEHPIWQRSFWDRQLRTGESYAAKWHYVRHNPVRKGFVATPDEWPYQGEMHVLEWHD